MAKLRICMSKDIYRLVSFQKNLSPNPSNLNTTLRPSKARSIPLKLIYIMSSIYKSKIKCFEKNFAHAKSGKKNGQPK